jgi:ABC-2 type transport system ATP-binding protein
MSGILETRGLTKWYGQVIGINDITVRVDRGITGLLGPNGAGKTTFIKIMTGQIRQTRGEALVLGETVRGNVPLTRKLGYCPELDNLYESFSGHLFLSFMLRFHGYSRKEASERAAWALDTVRLGEAGEKKIGAYSKGMRQRIKLAQAIAHEPEVFFLDEPLTGLDPVGRRQMIDLIRELGEKKKTVVVSSHILHEVEAMTDSILLIHNGRILAEGQIHQIRELIDEHPHNITIGCDRPRVLASALAAFEDVVSIRIDAGEQSLTAQSIRPDEFYGRLSELVLKHDLAVRELYSPDDNLQAVFNYLVK